MLDNDKIVRELSRLSIEINRLKQGQLELQKELIRYRLQEKIEEWRRNGTDNLPPSVGDLLSRKVNLH